MICVTAYFFVLMASFDQISDDIQEAIRSGKMKARVALVFEVWVTKEAGVIPYDALDLSLLSQQKPSSTCCGPKYQQDIVQQDGSP
jgi:hypothetical protein